MKPEIKTKEKKIASNHLSQSNRALLLVNLGSPLKPTAFHVACFLKQFLWDRRVVKLPRFIWWFILHFIVLPFRSKKVARLYQKIWSEDGSPLINYTQKLSIKLEQYLNNLNNDLMMNDDLIHELGTVISVYYAMTYSKPSIQSVINKILSNGISDLIILPLFPQYSGTTTAAVFDKVTLALSKASIKLPNTYFISHYCHQSSYLMALASTIRMGFEQYGPQDRLLFSFHGLPMNEIKQGDPYFQWCEKTAIETAKILKIPANYWKIAFQSRFGYGAWLKPSIEEQLMQWIQEGVKSIIVIAPSFAVDCLETKEELEIRTKNFFIAAGGESFYYIPALNDSIDHIRALGSIVKQYC